MPLSEEELRLLEQMERALSEEDPKFASALRGGTLRSLSRRRLTLAIAGFVLGLAILMVGVVVSGLWPVSIVGFLVMLGSAAFALTIASQRQRGAALFDEPTRSAGFAPRPTTKQSKQRRSGTFMQRLELRWERRRNTGGW